MAADLYLILRAQMIGIVDRPRGQPQHAPLDLRKTMKLCVIHDWANIQSKPRRGQSTRRPLDLSKNCKSHLAARRHRPGSTMTAHTWRTGSDRLNSFPGFLKRIFRDLYLEHG